MKNKKVYSSPEVEVTKFSFENILAGSETDDVDLQRIKQTHLQCNAEEVLHH